MALLREYLLNQDLNLFEMGSMCHLQVLVVSPGKNMQPDRIQLANELWEAHIPAEFGYNISQPLQP